MKIFVLSIKYNIVQISIGNYTDLIYDKIDLRVFGYKISYL